MRIYLAASFDVQRRMRDFSSYLTGMGHQILSGWVWQEKGNATEVHDIRRRPGELLPYAQRDLSDIDRSEVVVGFTYVASTTGGFHTEIGYALGKGKKIILVGPRMNVFHCMPGVFQIDSIADLGGLLKILEE